MFLVTESSLQQKIFSIQQTDLLQLGAILCSHVKNIAANGMVAISVETPRSKLAMDPYHSLLAKQFQRLTSPNSKAPFIMQKEI